MIIVMTRLPATQCVPCKLVNAGPDELRGTYLLDMVFVLGAFIIIMFMFHHHAFSLQSSSLFQCLQHHHCVQRKIFILQVVSFFIFHLFLPFESVTFIFLDSWQLTFNDVSPIQGNTEPTRDDCKDSCVYKYSTHLSFDPHWFQERRGWADFLLCLRWFPRRILPSRSNLQINCLKKGRA